MWPSGKRVHELSEDLRRELFRTFSIEPEDSEAMRYVAQRGRLGSGPVNRVCIFDPAVLSGPELAACNYENVMTRNEGLLFTGHILEGPKHLNSTTIVLYDQRA